MTTSLNKLSVVLATFNEEKNIGACLDSVRSIADEIIIVDGGSKDKTVEIVKSYGVKVIETGNPPIFHINKQKALEVAEYEWILQLDADERVTKELAQEITKVLDMDNGKIDSYQQNLKNKNLFSRHQKLLEMRDGRIGRDTGFYAAFFVPRRNFFLGKYLKYGGVYPDGVIRLVKKGKARFPCKSVHEQIVIEGRVGWLENDLLHLDSSTFDRYLKRNSRYIDLITDELREEKIGKNLVQFINFFMVKSIYWFFLTQIRHKGILDGWQGMVFSFFSALRFPRAYLRYLKGEK